jgi:hypothetical protein
MMVTEDDGDLNIDHYEDDGDLNIDHYKSL